MRGIKTIALSERDDRSRSIFVALGLLIASLTLGIQPFVPLSSAATCGPPSISINIMSVKGFTVKVNGYTGSGGVGCSITAITWSWGDGQSSTGFFPTTHTYSSSGIYTITATAHQSDGQTASNVTPTVIAGPISSLAPTCNTPSVVYSNENFPMSLKYQPYVLINSSFTFTPPVQSGPTGISVGVIDGIASVEASQGGQTLLATSIGGPSTFAVTSGSFACADFISNGQPLDLTITTIEGEPLAAYNIYTNYISRHTASLITYPPQFTVNMGPTVVPENTGISFLLVAPKFSLPTPLAIWVEEIFPSGGVQIGVTADWIDNLANSYFMGLGCPNLPDSICGPNSAPILLVPGDTYNITMALTSGTTWESFLNGTVTGHADLNTRFASGPVTLGVETVTAKGGNVNITNEIRIPVAASFRVNGRWFEPASFTFGGIGEYWGYGGSGSLMNAISPRAPGIDLWGLAGHLQDPTLPDGSLQLNDSLPIPLEVPTTNSEPLFGGFNSVQTPSGAGIVNVSMVSNGAVVVSPIAKSAFVSVASYGSPSKNLTSLYDALVFAPKQFKLPKESTLVAVYASNTFFNVTSISIVHLGSVSCKPPTIVVGSSTVCRATIAGTSPTGIVTWNHGGTGKFSTNTCRLSKGSCSVRYIPTSAGLTNPITASYSGDNSNKPSSETFSLTVAMRPTKTTISCLSADAAVGSSTTCTAIISGYNPTGTVTWSQSGGTGLISISLNACTLTDIGTSRNLGRCSVTLKGMSPGTVIIEAVYKGDSNNVGSSKTRNLAIR